MTVTGWGKNPKFEEKLATTLSGDATDEEVLLELRKILRNVRDKPPSKWSQRDRTSASRALALMQRRPRRGLLYPDAGAVTALGDELALCVTGSRRGKRTDGLRKGEISWTYACAWVFLIEGLVLRAGGRKRAALLADFLLDLQEPWQSEWLKQLKLPAIGNSHQRFREAVRRRDTAVRARLRRGPTAIDK